MKRAMTVAARGKAAEARKAIRKTVTFPDRVEAVVWRPTIVARAATPSAAAS